MTEATSAPPSTDVVVSRYRQLHERWLRQQQQYTCRGGNPLTLHTVTTSNNDNNDNNNTHVATSRHVTGETACACSTTTPQPTVRDDATRASATTTTTRWRQLLTRCVTDVAATLMRAPGLPLSMPAACAYALRPLYRTRVAASSQSRDDHGRSESDNDNDEDMQHVRSVTEGNTTYNDDDHTDETTRKTQQPCSNSSSNSSSCSSARQAQTHYDPIARVRRRHTQREKDEEATAAVATLARSLARLQAAATKVQHSKDDDDGNEVAALHAAQQQQQQQQQQQDDADVRALYDHVLQTVCRTDVTRAVVTALQHAHGATARALSMCVTQSVMRAIAAASNNNNNNSTTVSLRGGVSACVCTGVLRHIHGGMAAPLHALQLDDDDARVLATIAQRRDSDAVAVTYDTAGFRITFAQLATLCARCWLNDQVINNYLQLLCTTDNNNNRNSNSTQRTDDDAHAALCDVVSLGTHFYAKVAMELTTRHDDNDDRGGGGSSGYAPLPANSALLRWLRRRTHVLQPYTKNNNDDNNDDDNNGDDGDGNGAADASTRPSSRVRVVLIPVNLANMHWALVVWDKEQHTLTYYDSMCSRPRRRGGGGGGGGGVHGRRAYTILAQLDHVLRECCRHLLPPQAQASPHHRALQLRHCVADGYTMHAPPPLLHSNNNNNNGDVSDELAPYRSVAALQVAALAYRARRRARQHDTTHNSRDNTTRRRRRLHHGGDSGDERDDGDRVCAAVDDGDDDDEVRWFAPGQYKMPQQRNGYDCGVFVCQAAWCVAHGVALQFAQHEVPLLRQVMMLELWSRRLLRRARGADVSTAASADVCAAVLTRDWRA